MAGISFKRPIELIALLFSGDLEVCRQAIFTTSPMMVFAFDRYGNRRFDEANTTMPASFSNQALTNPVFDASNNRMAAGQGWSYDAAGNTIGDPEGRTFFYDAENKQVEVRNASSTTVGQYFYDGDGKRVKKYVPSTGETTVFAYDAAGKLIAEYSTVVAASQDAKVSYLTADHLGSPRINTDSTGSVTSRSDYMPYGEEITTQGGRSSSDGYVADDIRQGFTGYENDNETGLSFAKERNYARNLGRFTGSDPYLIVQEKARGKSPDEQKKILNNYILNAQTWNRYAFVLNSPLTITDKSGKCSVPAGLKPGQTGICVEAYIKTAVVKGIGLGDNRGPSGVDGTLTSRVRTDLIVSNNGNGTAHISWQTTTAQSMVINPLPAVNPLLPPTPPIFSAQGVSTTSVTNAVTESDGTTRFTLGVTATNGFRANYGVGPEGDIAFDFNLAVSPEGSVAIESGSQARTYPTIGIYSYTMDGSGNVTTTEIRVIPEQNIEDLTKPKQPV